VLDKPLSGLDSFTALQLMRPLTPVLIEVPISDHLPPLLFLPPVPPSLQVLVLDEPLSGLDSFTALQLMRSLPCSHRCP
jgi:ABC-type nitrate/sulfonate/bicarbonate transport system ATPase subunit